MCRAGPVGIERARRYPRGMLSEPAPDAGPSSPPEDPVLTGRAVAIALLLALLVALALNPFFGPPFPVVLGRTMFLAMLLLLAYTAARQWAPSWLPRWVAQLMAVAIAAPLGTLVVYLLSVGGNLAALQSTPFTLGFLLIAGSGLVLGLIVAFSALYRERDAQARTQALQFSLERSQLEKQALDARLSLLQAQIEPHFLFNTLANVKRLYETRPERGRDMLVALIAYLRAALPGMRRHESTLADELELVRHYLAILQMRMGERLAFDIAAPPELLPARLPTLVLPTLVENAIKHGLSPLPEGGRIAIRAAPAEGGGLTIEVADNGQGFGAVSGGAGVGLANTRARLAARFGDGASLELEAAQPHGVVARVRLPVEAFA